jgi:hypothetical protein
MAVFGARLETSGFFQEVDSNTTAAGMETRGKLLSALRDDRRTTWSSEQSSSRRNYSDITSAILARVNDPGLVWSPAPRDDGVFAMCTQ